MIKSKVLMFNFLVFLTYVSARDLGNFQDIFASATTPNLKEENESGELSDSELNDDENVFIVSVLTPDLNSTGLQEESADNKVGCIGGLLGFIQCLVSRKIESFSLELSKVAIPTKQPEGFRMRTMDPKIEGSLEDWLQKLSAHVNSLKEDCNDD